MASIYYLSHDVRAQAAKAARPRARRRAKVVGDADQGATCWAGAITGPFDELPAWHEADAEHRVIAWDEVSAAEGTGIVHIAPGCGREDFALSKSIRLPVLAPVDESGVYRRRLRLADGRCHVVPRWRAPIFDNLTREGLFLPDRVLPARLPALLALRDRTDLPAGGRVVHLDG